MQKWRIPKNPISQTQLTAPGKTDFIIGAPHADKGTLRIGQLLLEDRAFACLHPTSLINEIPFGNGNAKDPDFESNKAIIAERLLKTRKIVLSSHNLTWIVNLPENESPASDMVYTW